MPLSTLQQQVLLKKKILDIEFQILKLSKLHSVTMNICIRQQQTAVMARTRHRLPLKAPHCFTLIVEVLELAPCTRHWIADFVSGRVCISCFERCGVCTWFWSSKRTCFMWYRWLPNWFFSVAHLTSHLTLVFLHLVLLLFQFLRYACRLMRKFHCGYVHAVWWKVPCFFTQDYEEPLMFCLNEEDEENSPSQSGKGFIFKLPFNFLPSKVTFSEACF